MGKIITSFDIGIRNLAYCVLEYCPQNIAGNQFKIHDWNVIDLLKNDQKNRKCQITYQSGQKKGHVCEKLAHYTVMENEPSLVCKTHAKTYNDTQLKRFYTVANTSMFELVRLAVNELDKIDFSHSQEVIIESQPSKNPKMKNFSMALLNYFIIRYVAEKDENKQTIKDIKFISSRNKLTVYDGPYVECKLKDQHARNKFYGKVYCKYLIRYNQEKLDFIENFKKKDDLADSFLQGAWYLINGFRYKDQPTNEVNEDNVDTHADTCISANSDPDVNVSHDVKKNKIHLKLKKKLVGKELLENIRNNESTHRIKMDYNINKYKKLRRGSKPLTNTNKYTLSNIKYIMDHHLYDESNHTLQSSLKYYFGESIGEIINC